MPKISVIVPVYGVEKYIERCARSLFEQTLDDIEYIFVDDCTPDKSIEILEKVLDDYPVRKPQVKIVRLEKNGGLPQARKAGVQKATGDYLIHCDSDDWVDVTMYEKMYCKAIETDADMVWCDFYISDGCKINKIFKQEFYEDSLNILKSFFTGKIKSYVVCKLCRRTLYRDLVFPTANMHEDFVISTQLVLKCKKICGLQKPLYYYRVNEISISKAKDEFSILKRLYDVYENTVLLERILNEYGLSKELRDYLVLKKYKCKELLNPILEVKQYRNLFLETFQEINSEITGNRLISLNEKLRFFCVKHELNCVYSILMKLKISIDKLVKK